jgi:hypothetical protein
MRYFFTRLTFGTSFLCVSAACRYVQFLRNFGFERKAQRCKERIVCVSLCLHASVSKLKVKSFTGALRYCTIFLLRLWSIIKSHILVKFPLHSNPFHLLMVLVLGSWRFVFLFDHCEEAVGDHLGQSVESRAQRTYWDLSTNSRIFPEDVECVTFGLRQWQYHRRSRLVL